MIREGAWIRISDGAYWFVDEHSDWIKRPANAKRAGLPESVWSEIANIPNDYIGESRERILLTVMAAGFIRVRGHGTVVVMEFVGEIQQVLWACRTLLAELAGPYTRCRFNHLATRQSWELNYRDYAQYMATDMARLLEIASAR